MSDSFSTPDDFGEIQSSDVHTSLGQSLSAQASQGFMGGFETIGHSAEYLAANHGWDAMLAGFASQQPWLNADAPDVPIADFKARVKQEGLEGQIKIPDQDTIRGPVADMMMQDAREQQQHAAAVNRGPQGFVPDALGYLTSIGAGMIDPLNIAAFSIPVIGEARYGMMLARAGDSVAARGALRTGVGAAQGALGGAALVPADWWLHTQDGQDYTFADALKSVVLSAGMGAAAHGGGGLVGDLFGRLRGAPLSGSIEDLQARALAGDTHAADIVEKLGSAGVHLPEEALEPGGVDTDQVPGISAPAQVGGEPQLKTGLPPHPAEVLADLPPGAREDVTRAAIADVIKGEPVQAGELLQEAAKDEPRIAESIEAWHGSPHDFGQFDSSRIGTGEGADAYGHGLYFAENEKVAQDYERALAGANRYTVDGEKIPGNTPQGPALASLERASIAVDGRSSTDGFTVTPELVAAAKRDHRAFGAADKQIDALLGKKVGTIEDSGTVYKVRIAANKEHFLDYDKPLSEQSEHVKSAIAGLGDKIKTGWLPTHANDMAQIRKEMLAEAKDGGEFYSRLGRGMVGDKGIDAGRHGPAASAVLKEAGIPGIKYLDQGSRPAYRQHLDDLRAFVRMREEELAANPGSRPHEKALEQTQQRLADAEKKGVEATHNYVVFDDKLIRITHKNGKEVGLDEMKVAQTGEPGLPKIDNSHDVVSGANSAKDPNGPVYVDKRIPEFSPTLKDRDGNPANLHKYLAIHERTEAKAEAGGMPYLKAHTDVATPAERAAVEADGVSWKGYTDEIDGYLSKIEHEKATNPPTEPLHVDPEAAIGHHHSENKQSAGAGPALPAARAKPAKAKAPQSLLQFLAAKGGISDKDPLVSDVLQSFGGKNPTVPGHGKLIRGGGLPLDRARESAVEAGYLHDAADQSGGVTESTINHLLDAIDDEGRGAKHFPAGSEGAQSKEALEAQDEQNRADREKFVAGAHADLNRLMDQWGVTSLRKFIERKAFDYMDSEHMDAETALERAVSDFAKGDRDTPGQGGRADWDSLKRTPQPDDELVDASREADKAPAPPDTPEKAVSAAQKAAAEADKLLADILPTLSDAERKTFEDALADLQHDTETREQIVRDGAACLAAAAA